MRASIGICAWGLLCCLAMLPLWPASALAAGGNALVIIDDTYAGLPMLPNCRFAADQLLPRLHQRGFAVESAVDKPAGETRLAIARFAQDVAAMPGQPSVAYICAAATIEDQRLFLLPSDIDLQGPLDPETQGIVFPALFNALLGSGGTMVAELATQDHDGEQATLNALRSRLPNGLHLALTMNDASRAGSLGQAIAVQASALTSDWNDLVAVARAHQGGSTVALYAPAPVVAPPAPKPAPAPTPVAASDPAGGADVISPAASPAPTPSSAAPSDPPAETVVFPPDSATVAPPPAKMAQMLIAQPKPKPAAPAKPHANWRLLRVQTALRDQGLYHGPLSGMMNTSTVMAIRAYQISLGKSSSGTLTGPETAELLNGR